MANITNQAVSLMLCHQCYSQMARSDYPALKAPTGSRDFMRIISSLENTLGTERLIYAEGNHLRKHMGKHLNIKAGV